MKAFDRENFVAFVGELSDAKDIFHTTWQELGHDLLVQFEDWLKESDAEVKLPVHIDYNDSTRVVDADGVHVATFARPALADRLINQLNADYEAPASTDIPPEEDILLVPREMKAVKPLARPKTPKEVQDKLTQRLEERQRAEEQAKRKKKKSDQIKKASKQKVKHAKR